MGLTEYRKKRDFGKTDEPKAGKSTDKGHLIFVVQKHDASRLHYDFRLEMEGVLKSWAVPKGPSTDPTVKHLAMRVEDHPFDYRDFEGLIPEGEYGGGTVIVWDRGTYEPLGDFKGKRAMEKELLRQLESGSLKLRLHGEKLRGEYALVKTKGMKGDSWLLIKHKDEEASANDITKKDKSVLSGKTIEQMSKEAAKVWSGGKENPITKADKQLKKASPVREQAESGAADFIKKAPKAHPDKKLSPMKASLVNEPFDDDDWVFEVKWDGYRALAYIDGTSVDLVSRNNLSFNKFYPILGALSQLDLNLVLDGEIVVIDDQGVADFGALQNWRSEADGQLVYYVFDILWVNGHRIVSLPLWQRQAILRHVLPSLPDEVRISQVFAGKGIELFEAASRIGLEGIIAKKLDSEYISNARSRDWLKIKVAKRQEVIIAGFSKNRDSSKLFSALLLAVYEEGELRYAGKVGTGFSSALQKELMEKFRPRIRKTAPFTVEPDVNKPSRFRPQGAGAVATWLRPELIAEISFAEITSDGLFRQASFKGLREDKSATEVGYEKEHTTAGLLQEKQNAEKPNKLLKAPQRKERKTLLNPTDETQVRKICGRELRFTKLSKLYWPEDKFSKRDMFNYYYRIAEYILPYLLDRPLSLNRFPNGIHGKAFYQKDVRGKTPDWADKTYPYTNGEGEQKEYLVGSDEAYLMWVASLGCIEMNPWFSRVKSPDNPDFCVLDLDPDNNAFDEVIQVAQLMRELLKSIGASAFIKTSGSTGLHIYIPLAAKYTYDASQLFARLIANKISAEMPDITSVERSVAKRKGKIYLDFLQNRPGATIASVYSLRPREGVPVSTPLIWEELKPGLKIKDFNAFNIFDRLKETGDLFAPILGKGIDLVEVTKKLKDLG